MKTKGKAEIWATVAAVTAIVTLLAVAAFAQSGTFRFFGPLSRIITPNGDLNKNNGTAIFCFDNPADSGVAGNVFSLLGSAVATTGQEERAKMYEKATSLVMRDAASVWIYNTKWNGPFSKNVHGVRYSPIGDGQEMRWIYIE